MRIFVPTCVAIFSIFCRHPRPQTRPQVFPPRRPAMPETIVDSDMQGAGANLAGSKRRVTEAGTVVNTGGKARGSDQQSQQGRGDSEIQGRLPSTIGVGDHEKPLLEGRCLALQDLVLEVQDFKGAVYRSWKLEPESEYITQAMKFKGLYSKKCTEVKGTGIDLGHQRNCFHGASGGDEG